VTVEDIQNITISGRLQATYVQRYGRPELRLDGDAWLLKIIATKLKGVKLEKIDPVERGYEPNSPVIVLAEPTKGGVNLSAEAGTIGVPP